MSFRIRSAIAVIAVALGLLGAARSARALPIYDSGGFEPSRFTTGDLAGQDIILGPWLKDTGSGTGVVQTAVRQGGAQAVQISRPANANGDTRFGVQKQLNPLPPLTEVRVSWDMNVTRTQIPAMPFGPFFGVEGYDAFNDVPKLIGSLGVDATTGDILYQDEDGFLVETGTVAPFGQWNRYMLEFDYVADEYTVYYNGAPLATSPFIDPGIVGFTDAPLATLAATLESLATATGTAYFDNYTIEIVPEPSALAVVGLGSLALLRRRRA